MSISKYEAAAFYDFSQDKTQAQYLVLDFGDCSFGFCKCDNKGNVRLLHTGTGSSKDLWELCINAVSGVTGDGDPQAVRQDLEGKLSKINSTLNNYIVSDRMVDSSLPQIAGHVIPCSQFEECMRPVKTELVNLLNSVTRYVPAEDLQESRVIFLGRAQGLILIEHSFRDWFSADPLLPDNRIRNTFFQDSYQDIVRIGMKRYEAFHRHTYAIVIYNGQAQAEEYIALEQPDTSGDAGTSLKYAGPILFGKGDPLVLMVDEVRREIANPFSNENALLEVAVEQQQGVGKLYIRSSLFPTKVQAVELS